MNIKSKYSKKTESNVPVEMCIKHKRDQKIGAKG